MKTLIVLILLIVSISSFGQQELSWEFYHPLKKEWCSFGQSGSIQEKLSFNSNSIGIFESELPITINKNSTSTKLVLEKKPRINKKRLGVGPFKKLKYGYWV